MSDQPERRAASEILWKHFAKSVDDVLMPSALGCLTFLVLVQMSTRIPLLRLQVDRLAGRFELLQSTVASVKEQGKSQAVTLFVSPASAQRGLWVLVNGKTNGELRASANTLSVSVGDQIVIKASQPHGDLLITVEHTSPMVRTPEPGQTFELHSDQSELDLPTVALVKP